MKTKKTLKALVLSLAMALGLLLPTTMNAQTDGFFRGGEDYENRTDDATISTNGITNQSFNTPIGSGMIILVAAGLSYTLLKKKED